MARGRFRLPMVVLGFGLVCAVGGALIYWFPTLPREIPVPNDLVGLEPILISEIERLKAAVQRDASKADGYGALGAFYEAQGWSDLALRCYENARSLDSDEPRWHYLWAVLAAKAGMTESAEGVFADVTKKAPSYAPAFEKLGSLMLDRNNLSGAKTCYERLVEIAPDEPRGYIGLALVRLGAEDFSQAAEILAKAITLSPNMPQAHYLLGRAYQGLGRLDEAKRELALGSNSVAAPLEDPWSARGSEGRVTVASQIQAATEMLDRGNVDRAAVMLEKILDSEPNDTAVMNNLSVAYLHLNRQDDALRLLKRALHLDSTSAGTQLNLSMAYRSKGDLDNALSHVEQAAALAPWDGRSHRNKGAILAQAGRLDEAIIAFEEAKRVDPGNPYVDGYLGVLFARLKRWDEAIKAFEEAVQRAPGSADWHFRLGFAYVRVNRLDDAISSLRTAQSLEPNNDKIKGLLRRIESNQPGRSP